MNVTPLRNEHRKLVPHIEQLAHAAGSIATGDPSRILNQIREVEEFLTAGLIPHALAEEEALYPEVQRLMGAPLGTATMSRDHREVAALTKELGALNSELARVGSVTESLAEALRRVLYGLSVLVDLHFRKEEEVYLPLLAERLSEEEGTAMIAAMESAAQAARHTAV